MSTSDTQKIANLNNAQLSTGPRTDAGKQRSSQNAVGHAIFAKSIPERDQEIYLGLLLRYQQDFQPEGVLEEQLVETIAGTQWRLGRCRELQEALLFADTETPDQQLDALNQYSLYEQRLNRIVQSSHKQLRELQSERRLNEEHQFRDASQISKSFAAKNATYDPIEDGFVFSAADLALWIERTDRLQIAQRENDAASSFGRRAPLQ